MIEIYNTLSLYSKIGIGLGVVCLFIQLYYYLRIYLRVGRYRHQGEEVSESDLPPISVIITVRSEAEHLRKNLPLLLSQSYPKYEVVVVNDSSIDDTEDYLSSLLEKHSHLKLTYIPQRGTFPNPKKFAMVVGIRAAQYEHLLILDADCSPSGKDWLRTMGGEFSKGSELLIGYCGYDNAAGFGKRWIRYDNAFGAVQMFSYALNHRPYMGYSSPLGLTKTLFYAQNGFVEHAHRDTGEVDYIINQAGTSTNTCVCLLPDGYVYRPMRAGFMAWIKARGRQLFARRYMNSGKQPLWWIEYWSRVLYWVSAGFLCADSQFWYVGIGLLVLRLLFVLPVLNKSFKRLDEKISWFSLIIFDFLQAFIYLCALISYNISRTKHNKWR